MHSSFLLAEELLRRGRHLSLAFHGEGFARELARNRGLPYIDLAALGAHAETLRKDRFRLGNLTAFSACRRIIAQHNVTVVHVNDKRMLRTWCMPTWTSGRVLLTHWRGAYLPRGWSVDFGLRLSARIICVSAYSRDLLPAWARRKSEVVYNPFGPLPDGAMLMDARRRIRENAGIPPDAAVIGFFGALLNRKRPHMLLEILQRLTQTADGRPIVGVVCGQFLEPRDEIYARMLRMGNWEGRVVLAGFVNNVDEWMAACDVMIAPSIEEPLARVGVEAQLAGLPAIVSSDGGLREVVENGISGIVIDPNDFDAWVANVRRVLDDAAFASNLREGGRRAAANLTVERHVDAIEAIYDRLSQNPTRLKSRRSF